MANWKQTLDITDLMETFEQNEDAQDFAKKTSARITQFIEVNQSWTDRQSITDDLQDIAEGLSYADDTAEVDYLLVDLYDLADSARIWVKTF
jgi:hypothetical protein